MHYPDEISIDQMLGDRIRTFRRVKGFSQQALAQKIGITFQQIQKYESATNRISVSRLYSIAKILDISLFAILATDVDYDRAIPAFDAEFTPAPNTQNAPELELSQQIAALDPTDIDTIIRPLLSRLSHTAC